MPLVFPNIVRFAIIGNLQTEECVNIIDVRLEPTVPGAGDRSDAIFDAAGDILNNWTDHVLPLVTWAYQAREVRWVDLDSVDGTTGSRASTDAETWPMVGGVAAATSPNHTYARVNKLLQGSTRQARSGMLRLGGIAESATVDNNPNQLTPATITAMNTGFENFKDGIQSTASGWFRWLGVLHTVGGEAASWSDLSEYSVAVNVGTIRRRMPGYGV